MKQVIKMSNAIGIDLGSSKTVIFSDSKVVLEQPSLVTVDSETYEPVYFGEQAKQTLGRTPDTLTCIRPIERGLIADYDIAQAMLKRYMMDAFGNKVLRPRVMATLPTGLTELQHHSVSNVVMASGGRDVTVMEAPLAIAGGLDLDYEEPNGHLIVDVGAGTTDIAVLSLGGIVTCDSYKTASLDFDEQIINFVRRKRNIALGALSAEHIKQQVGSVYQRPVSLTAIAKGRHLYTGLPVSFEITSDEIYGVIHETALNIANAIRKVIERTEPDLVADIKEHGLYLVGGGSKIYGMDTLLAEYLGLKVHTVPDPEYAVVKGAAAALSEPGRLKNINYQLRSIRELEIH